MNTDPSGRFTLLSVHIANSIRTSLASVQSAVGQGAFDAAQAAAEGLSIEQVVIRNVVAGLAVGAGAIVASYLFRFLASKAGRLLSKLFKSADAVLVDSNLIARLVKDPSLGGNIGASQKPVVSYVSRAELANVVARNKRLGKSGLSAVPKILDELEIVSKTPDIDLVVFIRGQLAKERGRFGDAIIAAQAIERKLLLLTGDRELADLVNLLGGKAKYLKFP